MKAPSQREANLLLMAAGLLGRVPRARLLPLLEAEAAPPRRWSQTTQRALHRRLAVDVTRQLVEHGGWVRERHLIDGVVVEGRLWERHSTEALALSFSEATLSLLTWMLTTQMTDDAPLARLDGSPPTPGDQLVGALVRVRLSGLAWGSAVAQHDLIRDNPLAWLLCPEDRHVPTGNATAAWAPWLQPPRSWMLEALQPLLALRWMQVERSKRRFTIPEPLLALGQVQDLVLTGFLQAAEQAGRRDLARFLLMAAPEALALAEQSGPLHRGLDLSSLPLVEQARCYRAAANMLYHVAGLARWNTWAERVGYFDDDYAASQLLKADWQRWAVAELVARSQAILRQIDWLGQQPSPSPSGDTP